MFAKRRLLAGVFLRHAHDLRLAWLLWTGSLCKVCNSPVLKWNCVWFLAFGTTIAAFPNQAVMCLTEAACRA